MELHVTPDECRTRHVYTTKMLKGTMALLTAVLLFMGGAVVAMIWAVEQAHAAGKQCDAVAAEEVRDRDVAAERTTAILGALQDIREGQRHQRELIETLLARSAPSD